MADRLCCYGKTYGDCTCGGRDPEPPPGAEWVSVSMQTEGDRVELTIGGVTVRECVDCGCLTVGGPTRCKRCARDLEERRLRDSPYPNVFMAED